MTNVEILIRLLDEEVIPEIEAYMDELFALIADKKATEEDKVELEEIRDLRQEFKVMLEELENGEMDDEECVEIIEEIRAMREAGE